MLNVVVAVNGKRFSGWQRINLIRSMERGPFEFDLEVSHRWKDDPRQTLQAGQAVSLYLDNELLMTGFIDRIAPEYDAEQHALVISGRSRIGDLVDCSTEGRQYKQQTLLQMAADLCRPFSIPVHVAEGVDIGAPFKQLAIDEGQPIFEFLEQTARIRALRLMSTPDGGLLITRAGTTRAQASLTLGHNIRRASGYFSWRERFSEYVVVANQARAESLRPVEINHPKGSATDSAVAALRHRPLIIASATPANLSDCQTRAQWQRNTHYGRGQFVVYTLGGWRETDNGNTWQPNTRVRVNDPYSDIQGERLIVETRLILDHNGPRTELQVMPPEAMQLLPLPEPETDGAEGLSP